MKISLTTSATILLMLMLAGCAEVAPFNSDDFDKYVFQKIGLADKNKMTVGTDSTGTMCFGGEDLTSIQYKKACDAALKAKRAEIQQQQEAARIQAQKDAEAKRKADAELARRVAAIQAHPSRKVRLYEIRMARVFDVQGDVGIVQQCNLRSPYWLNTMFEAVQVTRMQLENASGLTGDNLAAVYDFANKRYRSVVDNYESSFRRNPVGTCQKFAGSRTMRTLDDMQLNATNNYH